MVRTCVVLGFTVFTGLFLDFSSLNSLKNCVNGLGLLIIPVLQMRNIRFERLPPNLTSNKWQTGFKPIPLKTETLDLSKETQYSLRIVKLLIISETPS